MRHRILFICTSAVLAFAGAMLGGNAMASERFAQKVTVQPGLVAVISEGDFEVRSIGSYAVRVYFDPGGNSSGNPSADTRNETTFYTAGLVRARDGFVRSAELLTVTGRKRPLLMVVIESAGSGGYLSADAFAIERHAVWPVASVSSLAPGDDPALALRRKLEGAAR